MVGKLRLAFVVSILGFLLIYFIALPAFKTTTKAIQGNVGTTSLQATSTSNSTPATSTQTTNTPTANTSPPHTVPLDQIVSGGPPPDGIPAIDNPKFISASQPKYFTDDIDDTVIGIHYNGETKAYPLIILVWHEIVNDVVGGKPIVITYCPLCYSTVAYIREINGKAVTFGTSGKLYNNNLVMYDRLTKSLWSQIWGEAIGGDLKGYKLDRVPIDVMAWGDWKRLYPDTVILSTDTGYSRPYGKDPYGGYYADSSILFPLSHSDGRLPLKKVVLGLSVNGSDKAYPVDNLNRGLIQDSLAGQSVVLFIVADETARAFNRAVDGKPLHFQLANGTFVDEETRSIWNYDGVAISGPMQGKILSRYATEMAFWFAWAAFYPDTDVYKAP